MLDVEGETRNLRTHTHKLFFFIKKARVTTLSRPTFYSSSSSFFNLRSNIVVRSRINAFLFSGYNPVLALKQMKLFEESTGADLVDMTHENMWTTCERTG